MKLAALVGILIFLGVLYTLRPASEFNALESGPATGVVPQESHRLNLDFSQIEMLAQVSQLAPNERWTLVNFWAHWCWPCHQELPDLNQWFVTNASRTYDVLLVNSDPEGSEQGILARNYLIENKIQLPAYFDSDQRLKQLFKINQLPAHFLISPDRQKVIFFEPKSTHWSHPKSQQIIEDLIKKHQQ